MSAVCCVAILREHSRVMHSKCQQLSTEKLLIVLGFLFAILDADADRYLRGVLERGGDPKAKCTKKQYGTGWLSICE